MHDARPVLKDVPAAAFEPLRVVARDSESGTAGAQGQMNTRATGPGGRLPDVLGNLAARADEGSIDIDPYKSYR